MKSKRQPIVIIRKDGTTTTWGPAQGYSWRKVEPGTWRTRHGAFSERVIAERAAAIREDLCGRLGRRAWLALKRRETRRRLSHTTAR
jgi:hypothetical protein